MENKTRDIYVIASEIRKDWKKVYFGAVPYLEPMHCLNTINDDYGYDSAKSIVLYFLSNANSWRGDVARRVKAELKELVKVMAVSRYNKDEAEEAAQNAYSRAADMLLELLQNRRGGIGNVDANEVAKVFEKLKKLAND